MVAPLDWNLYRTFLAVAQTGSLSAAARALNSSAATVGRQIEAIESGLALTLFTRSPSGLEPTAEAIDLVPHARAMAAAAAALARSVAQGQDALAGVVRITASEIMGAEVLPPILGRFRQRYPGVALELVLNNRTEDLLRRDADIAVRMTEPAQGALLARRIGQTEIGLYAHQDYLREHGLPETLAALPSHSLIGYDRDPIAVRMAAAGGIEVDRDVFRLRSDSDLAQLALVRAGCGIGGCQTMIAGRESGLVRVLPAEIRFRLPVWLVMHSDQRRVPRIRSAFDHLASELGAFLASAELSEKSTSGVPRTRPAGSPGRAPPGRSKRAGSRAGRKHRP